MHEGMGMPTCGVEAVILRHREVLLIKRSDFPVWCLPGGAIEQREAPENAVVREVLEETGLTIRLSHLAGIYSRPLWKANGDVCLVFAGTVVSGALRSSLETTEVAFLTDKEWPVGLLPWYPLIIGHTRTSASEPFVFTFNCRWPFQSDSVQEARVELAQRLPGAGEEAVIQYILDQTSLGTCGELSLSARSWRGSP